MLDFIILLSVLIIGVSLIVQSRKKDHKKILHYYSQPGKWFCIKFVVFYLFLTLRRLKYRLNKHHLDQETAKLDVLQPLSDHELAFDAVFFQAVDENGIYFCCGTERRQNGKVAGLVYLVVPEYGVLESEKLPHTVLEAEPGSLLSLDKYSAEGLVLTPIEPMKRWRVSFNGRMRQQSNPKNFVNVQIEAEWKTDYRWFLFEVHVPCTVLARAIARESWSREYFESLKEAHQKHYEQVGYLTGTLEINGETRALTDVDAFRDHSFGNKRDWSLMHRYIFHMFYLENRMKISFGVVSQPCTSSYLEMGFVNHPGGRMDPIESCDLLLYQHAENAVLPEALCFTFKANSLVYEVKVIYKYDAVHYKGKYEEARMCERFFECEVNGVRGRGISEWQYNEKHLK